MRFALLALVLTACFGEDAPTSSAPEAPSSSALMLFDFDSTATGTWTIENDGVMGGNSEGYVEVADGTLRFSGTLVTRGGGFSQTRAEKDIDLSGYSAIELRVRGGGRTFQLDVDGGTKQGWRDVARRGEFSTTADWQTVRVPLSSLETTAHGDAVEVAPLAPEAVQSLAIYIADGQDGPFRLEVDWIRAAE